MFKLVRVAFIALVAILLALAFGSCNKQPVDKQDSSPTTASSTAVPVVESATDVIPGVEDDDSLAATADDEESAGEDSGDDSDSDSEDDADNDDDGDEGDDNGGEDGQEQPSDGDGASEIVIPPPPDERPVDAGVLYSRNCSGCHGDDLGGAKNGPPLKGVAQHYGATELKRFLDDPSAYAVNDKRLVELGRQYSIAMPPAKISPAESDALAAWLLAE